MNPDADVDGCAYVERHCTACHPCQYCGYHCPSLFGKRAKKKRPTRSDTGGALWGEPATSSTTHTDSIRKTDSQRNTFRIGLTRLGGGR